MYRLFQDLQTTYNLYEAIYNLIGEDESYTSSATSAGLASIEADWRIEIRVLKL